MTEIETWKIEPFEEEKEILTAPNPQRWVLFPLQYDDIWKLYEKHIKAFWTVKEIDLAVDVREWPTLTMNEQYFIKHILAFFAGVDGIVGENLAMNFYHEITIPEARAFFSFQAAMEQFHSWTYSLLIDTLIKDKDEKQTLFEAVQNFPAVGQKAKYCQKYMDQKTSPFAERLLAFLWIEGIFFSGSFCSLFWLKKRGKMPGLTFSNELISRDEGLHCEHGALLYSKLTKKVATNRVHEMVEEAVMIESEFITESLPVNLIGMNKELMIQYIQFVADFWLSHLQYPKLYNVPNPFEWMESISLQGKTNFFEKRVGEYQKSDNENNEFRLDIDF